MTREPSPDYLALLKAAEEDVQRWLDGADDREPSDEPDPIVLDMWNGNSKRELAAARDDLAAARIRYDEAVLHARAVGWSWQEIGNLLGVSRQQLHRRYSRRAKVASRARTP